LRLGERLAKRDLRFEAKRFLPLTLSETLLERSSP
jgi:hypothetical protein